MIGKDLSIVLEIIQQLGTLETLLVKFYKACGRRWDDDFWPVIEQEERIHAKIMEKMADAVRNDPDDYERGNLLRKTLIENVNRLITDKTAQIEKGTATREQALKFALEIETNGIIEHRYRDLVHSNNERFSSFIERIINETEHHQHMLEDAINTKTPAK